MNSRVKKKSLEMPPSHPEAEAKNLRCGCCQWYSAGFNGITCKQLRSVEVDTVACREYTEPLDDPFMEIVVKDKYIQGIRESLKSPKFIIDDSILVEMRGYIIEDDFLKYKFGSKQDLEAINNTLKKIVQLRSRISTIFTSLIDIKYEFDEILNHTNLWLYSKYGLIRDLKNDSLRKAVFMRILPEIIDITKNIEKNMATAKYIEDHLENNERTLSKILGSSEKLWFVKEKI
jgi:hypothetical protein